MNAFNGVNLSAACILTSTENAQKLGIPEDKWVYVLGGAGTHEKDDCKTCTLFPSDQASQANDSFVNSLGTTAFAP